MKRMLVEVQISQIIFMRSQEEIRSILETRRKVTLVIKWQKKKNVALLFVCWCFMDGGNSEQ